MKPPRINWIFLITFGIASIVVFVFAMINPEFRNAAYAPLRELILPPPDPVEITVYYGTEKRAWLEQMREMFLATNPRIAGHPIDITLEGMGSREMYLAVLDGEIEPTVLSPASSLQISIFQELSAQKFGKSMVNLNDTSLCRPLVETPLVLVAWKERASVVWGDEPGDRLWEILNEAVNQPQGWSAYGRTDWGFFKFGHTNPLKSNSGFMTTILLAYEYHQKDSNLTTSDIQDSGFQDWFLTIEEAVPVFGDSTGSYMRDIIAYGPSMYDTVAVYESVAIEQFKNAVGRYGELAIYYPPQTIMSDHPFCILNSEWVNADEREAAKAFMSFLLSVQAQEIAVNQYGFRSVDTAVRLDSPGSPFLVLADNGIRISQLPPEVEVPNGMVLDALLSLWARNIK
jgi:hypothetical protein